MENLHMKAALCTQIRSNSLLQGLHKANPLCFGYLPSPITSSGLARGTAPGTREGQAAFPEPRAASGHVAEAGPRPREEAGETLSSPTCRKTKTR